MPFEIMDQRGLPALSNIYDLSTESQTGFWKQNMKSVGDTHLKNIMSDYQDGMGPHAGGKFSPNGSRSANFMEPPPQSILPIGQNEKPGFGGEGTPTLSNTSMSSLSPKPDLWSSLYRHPASYSLNGKTGINVAQFESSLFSSSLSEVFSRKLRLSSNNVLSQPLIAINNDEEEEEPFESLEEIEAQTIGNLLPDEDDLFSEVIGLDRHNHNGRRSNNEDEFEDFDLFSSGGGMELEGDDRLSNGQRNSSYIGGVVNGQENGNIIPIIGEQPHPSRTLFVRNINSNVEDSELKTLFERYGDIRTLYTACKHRGFVMISYYDIRSARNAMKALQNKPLRRRKLDIHYSIPKDNPSENDTNQGTLVVFNLDSSVSTDELHRIFGVHGEIKEIRETPHKQNHKFIEFYDVRAAEAALSALNRSDIAGKQIKLEPSRPGGVRRFPQQSEQERDEVNLSEGRFDDLSVAYMGTISPGVIASSSMDNGIRSPQKTFTEPQLRSSSISMELPPSSASIPKPIGLQESTYPIDEMNQFIPNFHPHSFPEYNDSCATGSPFNSSRTFSETVRNGLQMNDGLEARCIRGSVSNGLQMEFNGGVFGSAGNGNHFLWNNSNTHQQRPSNAMIWPHSPSVVNGIQAHRLPHMASFPRAPAVMMNAASPVHHHIGSAPAVNPPFWDRRHSYAPESPETTGFHFGSHGSMGFLGGSSPSHHLEIGSNNFFPHIGGNRIDMSTSNAVVGIHSPQTMCHVFPGRNPMISMPASFESPSERMKNLSHRRNESSSNHAEKKQFELDVDRIFRGDDVRTTLMIKNIPNKYTSKMLLVAIDEHCKGTYDFIYLPIDFKNKCNVGYAFINMIDPQKIIPFYQAFNGKKWEKFNSEKVASLAYARIQGKSALIAHFQNSSLMNEDKRCRPILFHTDGPNAGDQEPFPMGGNIRSRPGKPRTSGNNEETYGQPSSTISGMIEETLSGTDSSSKDSD